MLVGCESKMRVAGYSDLVREMRKGAGALVQMGGQ